MICAALLTLSALAWVYIRRVWPYHYMAERFGYAGYVRAVGDPQRWRMYDATCADMKINRARTGQTIS